MDAKDRVTKTRAALLRGLDQGRAELLLERWMTWASGVAFKSEMGEKLIADTDAFLARVPEEAP